VGEGHFDGLMHYPVMEALTGLLLSQSMDAVHFAEKVEGLLSYYPHENVYAMYTPLGSHDTERILTKLGNDIKKARLAYLFQFAYPGAPAIYYGDEVVLTGGKDPGCRGAFPWDESKWNVS
jgi:glycosidase